MLLHGCHNQKAGWGADHQNEIGNGVTTVRLLRQTIAVSADTAVG
jgi:hypothetical protein